MIPNRPAKHRIACLERIQHVPQRHFARSIAGHLQLYIARHARERLQMRRQHHNNHGSVCVSTDSTAGKSRTIGAHVSPASGEQYTCPPVVPKYTPHLSSESTDIASRSTFT